MQKIIYYVASSHDSYIDDSDDDISKFTPRVKGVEKYL